MKTTTDKLFKLIKSMSPAEKRYFKRHYGSESNTLTHLYDAINQQKEYNEEAIKEQFTGKVAANLKVYKFQLEQLLLKSLTSHRHFSTIGSKIRLGLEHFEILLDKNLPKMAEKQLEKTKQLCLEHEKLEYLPLILAQELKMNQIKAQGMPSIDIKLHKLSMLFTQKTLCFFQEETKLNGLINLYLQHTESLSRTQIQGYLSSFDLDLCPEGLNQNNLALLNAFSEPIFFYLTGENEKACIAFNDLFSSYIPNYKKKPYYRYYYLNSLKCAIDNCFILQKVEEVEAYIEMGYQFCAKNESFIGHQMFFAAQRIKLEIQKGQLPGSIKKQVQTYEERIKDSELEDKFSTQFYYVWMSIAYLVAGEFQKSLKYTQLIQKAQLANHSFMLAFGRIMEFIVYFEEPDFQKIAQFLTKVKSEKLMRASDPSNDFYDEFISFADQSATNPRTIRSHASTFLEQIEKNNYNPLRKLFLDCKLDRWLIAILKEESFKDYLLRKPINIDNFNANEVIRSNN